MTTTSADSNNPAPDCCVALFARLPVPGRVKTRLIPALGPAGACTLHVSLLGKALQMLEALSDCDTCLWLDQPGEHAVLASYTGQVHIQQGADLGARLEHAAEQLLGCYEAVIFIGTDCPALDAEYLRLCLALLGDNKDLVIGPARDGGYVLLGIRTAFPGLFRDIDWGTAKVLQQTLDAAALGRLRIGMLPEMADIDRPEDLRLPEIRSLLPAGF